MKIGTIYFNKKEDKSTIKWESANCLKVMDIGGETLMVDIIEDCIIQLENQKNKGIRIIQDDKP